MKESTEIEEKLLDKKHEDAVLKYLAENHPDDENALSEMTALLDGATDSQALLDAVYRGIRSEQNAKDAENAGYLRGKNEAIEMRRAEIHSVLPADDSEDFADSSIPLLRHIRRSVWD